MAGLTTDELSARLSVVAPHWSPGLWAGFLEASPDDQTLMVRMLAESAVPPPTDGWAEALKILLVAAEVAGAIAGIASGVTAIEAIVKLAK
jgi:hypothetical protein